ncbi:protein translocase subunit secE/sec61 gamma [Rhodococcus sp. OK519]|uniref:preprotein translocase subunit SecE n=1 Tax=Rhodococcus sp. OK519 TaxID=2135729 RepID=UPI000D46A33F|nr:protein translocase subunit secE/sec61 gamma [Rhodococcus sp. OK519]
MSDERDKRDDGTSGSMDPDAVDGSVAGANPRPESEHSDTAGSGPASVVPSGKPSGKRAVRRGAADVQPAKKTVAASSVKSPESKPIATKSKADKPRAENIFKRIRRFLREVVAELRKVIWPNRKQMITYTSVVLVFVAFMVTFISLLDLGFIKGVSWLFG